MNLVFASANQLIHKQGKRQNSFSSLMFLVCLRLLNEHLPMMINLVACKQCSSFVFVVEGAAFLPLSHVMINHTFVYHLSRNLFTSNEAAALGGILDARTSSSN